MTSNSSLIQIGEVLANGTSVAVLPHISPDGDGLGSAIALARTLRARGQHAVVVIEEEIPNYIAFLNTDCVCIQGSDPCTGFDTCVVVDCSEESRIPSRIALFNDAEVTLCIDHHLSNKGFGDYYYIDETAAAASELVYMLIDQMGWDMDVDAATALYTGIVTDTGSFQYSNTTSQTHEIAGELIDRGVSVNDISVELFQNIPYSQIRTQNEVLKNLKLFAGGKAGIAYATDEIFKLLGTNSDDAEGVIDIIRDIRGVEIAAFLKEKDIAGTMAIKVSLRAKTTGDVQQIAARFNGGGHKKAAGCTIYEDMETAVAMIKNAIAETLND